MSVDECDCWLTDFTDANFLPEYDPVIIPTIELAFVMNLVLLKYVH